MPKTNVEVELIGQDGNAFFIIGKVSKALRQNGHADLVKEFQDKATSGDYNNVLATVMEYVEITGPKDEEDDDYDFEDDMEED